MSQDVPDSSAADAGRDPQPDRRHGPVADEFRALFEHAGDAIVIFEAEDETILDANATACEMYGYPHDELVGLSVKTLTVNVSRGWAETARLKETGRSRNYKTVHRRKSGEAFHIVSNATLVEHQGRQAILSIVRDVEESFLAEEERRRLVRDLGRRVSELTLLHRAARLLQNNELDLPALLERLVALMPHGWRDSHLAAARVAVGRCEYRTVNWAETADTQEVAFETKEGPGLLQVAYPGSPLSPDAPRFTREEQQVLESLADMLGASIEQRSAQSALRRSEEYFRSLIENASDAISVISLDGTITYSSASAQRLMGHTGGESVGMSAFDLLHPDDQKQAKAVIGRILETEEPQQVELRVRTGAGAWRRLEIVGSPLREDGRVTRFVLNSRDVTERHEAEVALRAAQAFRQAVERSLLAGVRVVDPTGRLTYVNPAFCEMVGWGEDELTGAMPPYPYWPSGEETRLQALLDETLAGRVTSEGIEISFQRKNGERFDALVLPSPLHDSAGLVTGWLAAVYDITERKRLEEHYRQAQKMEAIGRLAGGVAHDFNNLLTAILGYTELASDALGPAHPVTADLAEVRKAGESATRLVGQLLAFSRRQVVELQPLDLNLVAKNVEGMLSRVIGEDVSLVIDLDRTLPLVEADAGQMEQVLMNLAVNARDAMPNGGRLAIETSAVVVDESLVQRVLGLQPGPYARLTIRDTGAGMDPSVQVHLFEPFFTTKPKGKGTGLGLATVYGIVQQAGGRIDVRSTPGQGSTFDIYLPVAETRSGTAAAGAGAPADLRTGTVLLVEDDQAVRELARRILVEAGFTVSEGTAHEALALASRPGAHFDLLLTDIVMPGMSGGELAQRFAEIHRDTPVIFMTGYTEDQVVRAGVEAGAVALLRKPFTADALLAKIGEAMGPSGDGRT